ncbi:ABC transporter ATP-binding protein [Psychrobacillus sp. OK032]|uniref:ABC transporter ATP-binding protein n=1 Tax=Psychrobacillus sp. OK032 TaxID=1884358 RepID=UPI0008D0A8BF|nr:ABC transporter ATP-binding protein [Psychrobacillus sp. OK032]SER56845.1 branched-chain amino acid transport system ATP-binding protein [Psychrobacillus sp. OK032]
MPILEVNNIETYYGGIQALKGISVYVNKGEIVTLIGSNGAGKSTTLKSISGLAKVKTGSILFKGKETMNKPVHETCLLGMAHVPEGRKIFSTLTVKENLLMGAFSVNNKQLIEERMEIVFGHFPILKKRLEQKGGTMSGGEQQMLAIGRALMMEPELLMLDEPSMGLAPIIVEQIFDIIKKLNQNGITILLVEQNAYQALNIAHRGYVIRNGEIVLSGKGSELIENIEIRDAYLA